MRVSHIQAAIWRCDNKPRLSAADAKAQQEQKGLERRATKLDDNTLRIAHQDSKYGHHKVPIGDKGGYRCLKCGSIASSYKSSKWNEVVCGNNSNVLSEAHMTPDAARGQ